MENTNLLLFSATVLPLICTPGPDMLFVASQAISGGAAAGLRSTVGICVGYVVHSTMAALGLAAIIAASPLLFAALRWLGIAYLSYLAFRLIASSLKGSGVMPISSSAATNRFRHGFLTAVLNPKGMMIYFAILPQFMSHDGSIMAQASLLSAVFISLCGIVYALLSLAIATLGSHGNFTDRRRRWVEGIAGGLLLVAAGRLAT
ncbi:MULTISPECIES: LysE family translocator [unclassified Rhizobium]|jgi:threonine/homoserine/homoserine lactone efflux protein|uniref:LysE family translocator n=1 Tax=unclassified Rhizobium TaxID=2613769 RepID=UPI0006470581|nr:MULTISPECIES: LysE family translocator [unclassified Rhizobium]MBN8952167.1 LysE family translocator [Rhizobium tropici]OJY77895.1 MAG: amino acid transporter [Rhizobium sp. 60-20]RKD56806.1 threonine/homoserine/homoserine lactone efflux protein [Rhizobium sp. WW_1]